jgi:hypothetical protein
MINARRHIPRRADIPLHVGVEGEEFAVRVEGDVVMVAESERKELEALPSGSVRPM